MVKARPSGAGASAHERYRQSWRAGQTQRLVLPLVLVVVAAVAGTVVFDWRAGLVLAVLAAGGGVVALAQEWRTHEAVRTWRRGALGERRTARRLRQLELAGYTVLHDRALPRGRANIDHLVVGPKGVFVLDSKVRTERTVTRRGRTVQLGHRWRAEEVQPLLYEAESVATALSRAVRGSVKVTPVLVVHGARVPWRGMVLGGVQVLRPGRTVGWVLSRPGPDLDRATLSHLQHLAPRLFPPYVGRAAG